MCHTTISSFSSTALTVIGQNYGAKKPERIRKAILCLLLSVAVSGILIGQTLLLFAEQMSWLFVDSANPAAEQIIGYTVQILTLTLTTSFINGTWQMLGGAIRGMGYSFSCMIISLLGACVFRILWITFIFPMEAMNNIMGLYLMFPCSWILTGIMLGATAFYAYKKLSKNTRQAISE